MSINKLLDRLENYDDFECPGGPLRLCLDWLQLKADVDRVVQERDTLARRVQEWQPIETAPKDGTIIDVWLGDADRDGLEFYCTPGTKRSSGWRWKDGKFRPVCGLNLVVTEYPTHWMPLPAPPVTGGPR